MQIIGQNTDCIWPKIANKILQTSGSAQTEKNKFKDKILKYSSISKHQQASASLGKVVLLFMHPTSSNYPDMNNQTLAENANRNGMDLDPSTVTQQQSDGHEQSVSVHGTATHTLEQPLHPISNGASNDSVLETTSEQTPMEQDSSPLQKLGQSTLPAGHGSNQNTTQNGVVVTFKTIDSGPAAATKVLTQQTQEIIIPSYSSWFSFGNIHNIERKALPEFFNNKNKSKTPQVYKDYRDFMINTYRLNPSEYLTVTACRRNLAGDVCAIIRVHAVLEQWGLINYQVDPDSRPSAVGPAFTGHFRVTADTPRGLQPLFPNISISKAQGALPTGVSAATSLSSAARAVSEADHTGATRGQLPKTPLALSKNIYEQDASATLSKKRSAETATTGSETKKPKLVCSTCGVECTKSRYHCTKSTVFDICPNCYLEGRFPSTYFSGDFLKLEDGTLNHDSEAAWTDQETLLLLEGIELFDDNWNKIAEHVGTRTRDQCILQFLQLPIEDTFLERKQDSLGPLQYARVPFSAADNPVLSLAAFLAAVVPPNVAAAAAESAIRKFEQTTVSKQDTSIKSTDDAFKNNVATPSLTTDSTAQHEDSTAMDTTEAAPKKSSTHSLEVAGATALGAAAAKARAIADCDEHEMQRVTRHIIEVQLKKMELKLQHFNELEAILEHERKELERERLKLFLDRLALRKTTLHSKDVLPKEGASFLNLGTSLVTATPARLINTTSGDVSLSAGPDGVITPSSTTTTAVNPTKPDPNAKFMTITNN
ncbi:SWI/SNF and RSC complex subunit Ssr2 [Batrachochytrium dendrobatidis]|nr:SWI/SNF and RSC complex subunit Ssr2 [Batrachochytrium dendrobatidis]KAK5666265.1 SWI/SNF and RSC complex subunit Ssr2 [Batrachochytrium dendrobatidis]